MKVWVLVEGESDRLALLALWSGWLVKLYDAGHGIAIIPLKNKDQYFRKMGARAAEKLVNNDHDLVVGLPDFYPSHPYACTEYGHPDVARLQAVQKRLVKDALEGIFSVSQSKSDSRLERFHASALKHDLEMLLLAAVKVLRTTLTTSDRLGGWRHPVEEQDQTRPPKYVVEELFLRYRGRRYRDTTDAKAVLEKVADLNEILLSESGQLQCPVFKEMLDWIGERTGVGAY